MHTKNLYLWKNEYNGWVITKPTKYTPEFVLQEVRSVLAEIQGDLEIFYLWQVFEKRGYSQQRYSEWKRSYGDNQEISETMERIWDILETRVVVGAMKRELHPTIAVFHLKNNYKWSDKVEIDQRNINFTMPWISELSKMTDEELLALTK